MPTAALADDASLSGEQPAEYFLEASDQIDSTIADSEQTSDPTDAKHTPLAPNTEESTEEVVDPIDPTTPIQGEMVSEPEYTEPDEPSEPVQNEVESFIENDSSSDTVSECTPENSTLDSNCYEPEYTTDEYLIDTSDVGLDLTNEELFAGYVEKTLNESLNKPLFSDTASYGNAAKSMLTTPLEKYLYDSLKEHVVNIASGKEDCSKFEFSVKDYIDSSFFTTIYKSYDDYSAAVDSLKPTINTAATNACEALKLDYPYELYWSDSASVNYGSTWVIYDNDSAYDEADSSWHYWLTDITYNIRLDVNVNYQTNTGDYSYDICHTDTTLTQAPTKTVENAQKVVNQYASLSDYEKLVAYKDWICDQVSYDYYSNSGTNYEPWQIMYVFDNDPDTNVVCSGYTKAFQYLCDLSIFRDPTTKCYSVGGSAGGWHTWNIVTLTNSKGTANYLADVTWTDGDYGQNEGYFLNGARKGNIKDGYFFGEKPRYEYKKRTLNLFGTDTSSILNLSLEDYITTPKPSEPEPEPEPWPGPGSDNPSKPNDKPSTPKPTTKTGWVQNGGTWYYYNPNGTMLTGWQKIGGEWYYLNPSGVMLTGWQKVGGTWYYLNPSGAMATGWAQVGGTWYYLKSSGAMATGWQQIGGAWYYLNGSGAMQTGWYKVGPKWYYSNGSGAMQSNRWIGNYYVGPSGAMATSQWVGPYYVNASGLWVN